MYNQNFLDAIALVSFWVGVANYDENLTQNDKQDLIRSLDSQTKEILENVQEALERQNTMLCEILDKITLAENEVQDLAQNARLGDTKM